MIYLLTIADLKVVMDYYNFIYYYSYSYEITHHFLLYSRA
nr:MAG TPA: hypothetical protein [Caudoviricetes sp.]